MTSIATFLKVVWAALLLLALLVPIVGGCANSPGVKLEVDLEVGREGDLEQVPRE